MSIAKFLLVLSLFSCGATVCATRPFLELNDLFTNKDFMYEQVMAPPALRKFFIPLSLIAEGAHVSVQWCERIKLLLDGISISASMHYVSRSNAPFTYTEIMSMAMVVDIPMPLIFLADKYQHQSTKTVDTVVMDGGFYALVFNQAFIMRRTEEQLRALVARELAQIARTRNQKKHRLQRVAQSAVVFAALYGAYSYGLTDWLKKYWWHMLLAGVTGGALLKLAEIGDQSFNKVNDTEIERIAVQAFSGGIDAYLANLKTIEVEELSRAQRREFQYYGYFSFLLRKMDEMSDMLSPYALCFLKSELMYFSQVTMKKPAYFKQAGFSNNAE